MRNKLRTEQMTSAVNRAAPALLSLGETLIFIIKLNTSLFTDHDFRGLHVLAVDLSRRTNIHRRFPRQFNDLGILLIVCAGNIKIAPRAIRNRALVELKIKQITIG